MVEPNKFEHHLMDASDQDSTNIDSISGSEDAEPDLPPNTQSVGSSEPSTLLNPSRRGRNQPESRMNVVPSQTRQAVSRIPRQLHLTRSTVPKPPTTKLALLIFTAVATCQKKSGLSLQALKKIITNMGYDMAKKKHYFLRSIKGMLAKGQLWQVKGTGATGSFKVNPDMRKKKDQLGVRGKRRKAKGAAKKRGNRNKTKQRKTDSSRAKISSMQGAQSQVKV